MVTSALQARVGTVNLSVVTSVQVDIRRRKKLEDNNEKLSSVFTVRSTQ